MRITRAARTAVLACGLFLLPSLAGAAPILFDGQTVQLTYEFPTLGSVLDSSTFVVGAGIEDPSLNSLVFDFSDTNISIDYSAVGGSGWASASFNGFHVFDVNGTIPTISAVTINAATNLVGLTAARITFDADNIWVNWQGLAFNQNTRVSLDVSPASAPVPEPASLILVGSGVAGIVARARRRKLKLP